MAQTDYAGDCMEVLQSLREAGSAWTAQWHSIPCVSVLVRHTRAHLTISKVSNSFQ